MLFEKDRDERPNRERVAILQVAVGGAGDEVREGPDARAARLVLAVDVPNPRHPLHDEGVLRQLPDRSQKPGLQRREDAEKRVRTVVTCGADSLNHMHLAPMHPPHLPLAGHILPSGHFSFAAHFTPPDDGSVGPSTVALVALYRPSRAVSTQVPT